MSNRVVGIIVYVGVDGFVRWSLSGQPGTDRVRVRSKFQLETDDYENYYQDYLRYVSDVIIVDTDKWKRRNSHLWSDYQM
jgi:hypothetical protein